MHLLTKRHGIAYDIKCVYTKTRHRPFIVVWFIPCLNIVIHNQFNLHPLLKRGSLVFYDQKGSRSLLFAMHIHSRLSSAIRTI